MTSNRQEVAPSGTADFERLQELVNEFNEDLTGAIRAFTGKEFNFKYKKIDSDRLMVRLEQQDQKAGIIPLTWNGHLILGLRLIFKCSWDSTKSFLAVEQSSFAVYPEAKPNNEPLFRVEYDRSKSSRPSSHFHVHAHRDEMTHLLGLTKKLSVENNRKVKEYVSKFPTLSKFHFPTGGHRFRPCLEDVLEVLRQEFRLDVDNCIWQSHLKNARLKWRRIQVAAVVRDSPQAAFDVLVKELGMPIPLNWNCPSDDLEKIVRD